MGQSAIEALGILTMVELVLESNVITMFPKIFQGLGKLKHCYTIKTKQRATPFAPTTPRRIALPLLPKVKAELQRMKQLGVMVKEPTECCSGILVVPKPNEKIRICVDLTIQAQPEYLSGVPDPSICGDHPSTNQRSEDLLKARCQPWILASQIGSSVFSAHNIHYPIWKILLQAHALWDHIST